MMTEHLEWNRPWLAWKRADVKVMRHASTNGFLLSVMGRELVAEAIDPVACHVIETTRLAMADPDGVIDQLAQTKPMLAADVMFTLDVWGQLYRMRSTTMHNFDTRSKPR